MVRVPWKFVKGCGVSRSNSEVSIEASLPWLTGRVHRRGR